MGLNAITLTELKKHLPCSILAFGYPGGIEKVDLRGSTLEVVDLFQHEGMERVADLSLPQKFGEYDLVLDCGTTEHVANPAQAFLNAANTVKVGGRVMHHLPLTMVNHGYWNICPSFLADFYIGNGFEIERFDLTVHSDHWDADSQLPWDCDNPKSDLVVVPANSLILFVARKVVLTAIRLPKCESKWVR